MMERRTTFFVVGSVAALVLVTLVALGFGSGNQRAAAQTAGTIGAMTLVADSSGGVSLEQIQAENARLRTLLTTMQARETTYRQQVDAANQALLSQQSDNTAALTETVSAQSSAYGADDNHDGANDDMDDGLDDHDDGPDGHDDGHDDDHNEQHEQDDD
jgi:hypothetical protein